MEQCKNCRNIDSKYELNETEMLGYIEILEPIWIKHNMERTLHLLESDIKTTNDIKKALLQAYISGFNERADTSTNLKIKQ